MTELNSSYNTINKIISCLEDGKARNISEISKKSRVSWEIAKSTLEKLELLNLVFKKEETKNKYYINPKTVEYNTYFNLPISKLERNRVFEYFYLVQKAWEEKTSKLPTRIQIYKVLSKLNKQESLKLPFGLYIYGECCLVPYDYDFDYSNYNNNNFGEDLKQKAEYIIEEYKHIVNPRELRKLHYNETKQKAYQLKEEILDLLYYSNDFQNNKIDYQIIEKIKDLADYLVKDNIPQESIKLVYDFLDIIYLFKANEEKNNILNCKEELIDTFKNLWSLIATNYFKKSFEREYENKILNECFKNKLREDKELVLNNYFNLSNILRNTFNNPELNKYFEKVKIKESITRKDIKNTEKQLTKEDKDEILKEIGMD